MDSMKDDDIILLMFMAIVIFVGGMMLGIFFANFTIPTMKIWESNRTYDRLLVADTVVCNPIEQNNLTYYSLDTVIWNKTGVKTEYLVRRTRTDNTTLRSIIVCGDS